MKKHCLYCPVRYSRIILNLGHILENDILHFYLIWFKRIISNANHHPGGNYTFIVNNRNTRKRCEICSKFTILNFEHISHLILVFLLLTLNRMPTGQVKYKKQNKVRNAFTTHSQNDSGYFIDLPEKFQGRKFIVIELTKSSIPEVFCERLFLKFTKFILYTHITLYNKYTK